MQKISISLQKCNWLLQVATDLQHSVNQPLCLIDNIFTYLFKSKPVKQEFTNTMMLF